MQGLGVLCPLDSFTIEQAANTMEGSAMKGNNKMGGLARGCGPDGTADELSEERRGGRQA